MTLQAIKKGRHLVKSLKTDKLWEAVIGLEVHAQILCETKLFSGAPTNNRISDRTGGPNNSVSFIDAALPGCLPVLNQTAVQKAVKTALALGSDVNSKSNFERKHYFYCDLPQGYQITQQTSPIASGGYITLEAPVHGNQIKRGGKKKKKKTGIEFIHPDKWDEGIKVRMNRIQLEQDSGKSIHDVFDTKTLVDLNRAGSALMELVFEPDLRSSTEIGEFMRSLQAVLRELDTCNCNMEDGSLRCDVNISVKPIDNEEYGERVEIKNMNSIKHMMAAVDYEISRQVEALESDEKVLKETRTFDPLKKETRRTRRKEGLVDYRFFPEPDLPPLILEREFIEKIASNLPLLPAERKQELVSTFGLSNYDAHVMVGYPLAVSFFEETLKINSEIDPKQVCNWLSNDLFGAINEYNEKNIVSMSLNDCPVTPKRLSELLDLLQTGTISTRTGKELLKVMFEEDKDSNPIDIVKDRNWMQINDAESIEQLCRQIIFDEKNAESLLKYKNGKKTFFKFFMGKGMEASNAKANAELMKSIMQRVLDEECITI